MTTFLAQTVIFLICCLLFQTTYICSGHICVHPKTLIEIAMVLSTNSGSFDEQRLFSVKFARFRNFFDFAQIWGILDSDKLEKFNADGPLMGRTNLDKSVW